MAFGFNGIAHSTSTLNSAVIRLFNNLGYASQAHWTKYLGGTPLTDALLGIKYVISADEKLDSHYYTEAYKALEQVKYGQPASTIYAWENKMALPIMYGVSPIALEKLADMSTPYYPTAADAINDIVKSLLGNTDFNSDVYKPIYAHHVLADCNASIFTQACKYIDANGDEQTVNVPYRCFAKDENGKNPVVKYIFNAIEAGPIYAHFPMDNFGKKCDIYVNDAFICTYDSAQIVNLGEFQKGDKVVVELALEDAIYFTTESGYYFFYPDYEAQDKALEYLHSSAISVEKHSNTMIKGTVSLSEGQNVILTTIPYDNGWKCYIDGERVEITRALGSLIAIEATAGEHTVEMRYMPDCYVAGFIISGLGIASFAAIIAWPIIKKRREKAAQK